MVSDEVSTKIGDFNKVTSLQVTSLLLTVIYLTFEKNPSRKINALARISPYRSISKRRILINAFFKSRFNHCLLIWKCHSQTNNRKINKAP